MNVFLDTNVIVDVLQERQPFFRSRDFEDAMQYESALLARADVIVTRDPDGFANSKIRVLSPSEFLKEVA